MILIAFIIAFFSVHGMPGQSPDVPRDARSSEYYLLKPAIDGEPGFSGDRQHVDAGGPAETLRARVVNQLSEPVAGIPVIFEVVNYPSEGRDFQLERNMVITDPSGVATVGFRAGSAGGEYQVMARIRSVAGENVQIYYIFVREKNWLLSFFIGLTGGLALFLLGLGAMRRGMLCSAGARMRSVLGNSASHPLKGLGIGAFINMVIQSSSEVSSMLVSLTNAGMMKFRKAMIIIMGAAIGTSLTAQVIAFRLTDISLLFVAAGFVLLTLGKKEQFHHAGNIILGFGVFFFGMEVMSEALYPFRSYDPVIQLLRELENPLYGILAGTLFTVLIRSSTAFIGIMIILGTQGLLTLEASIPLLFGVNAGIAVTSLLAGIRRSREAKKVALAVFLFKILGIVLFFWWIDRFAFLIQYISPESFPDGNELVRLSANVPRQIANAHMIFNLFMAMLVLPFTGVMERLFEHLVPSKPVPAKKDLHYCDEKLTGIPVMALSLAREEAKRAGEIVYRMVESSLPVFLEKNSSLMDDLEMQEEQFNFLRDKIDNYLLKITRQRIREERVSEALRILYFVRDLDLIARTLSNLRRMAGSWLNGEDLFNDRERGELVKCHNKTLRKVRVALSVFSDNGKTGMKEEKTREDHHVEIRKQGSNRLITGNRDRISSSAACNEIMTVLFDISNHAAGITKIRKQS